MKLWTKKAVLAVCVVLCCSIVYGVSQEEIVKMEAAAPSKASATPKKARKLLMFTRCEGYRHSSIPFCSLALRISGKKTRAFETTISKDMSIFDSASLAEFDAICFNNTTKLEFNDAQRKALMDFVKGGKGIVGIHAATDNFYKWPEAAEMMGGTFDGHPWGAGGTWAVRIEDPAHPVAAGFEGRGFKVNDEIYRTRVINLRQNSRILVGLDMTDKVNLKAGGVRPDDVDIPISWIRDFGKGRVFYCAFGHNHHLYWTASILKHYLDGIQFAMGDLEADTTPLAFRAVMFDEAKLAELLSGISGYDYGQSRAGLNRLSSLVKAASVSTQNLNKVEKKFLAFLESEATLASKQFICRELSIIGSEASAETLGAMLTNSETSDMARYAMERIPGKAIDKALRGALAEAGGKEKIGIINTLGMRGDGKSVKALRKLVDDSNTDISAAAIAALGRIGGSRAAKALGKVKDKLDEPLGSLAVDAYMSCAEKFAADGKMKDSFRIYEDVYESKANFVIRAVALRGMIKTAGRKAADIIVDVLKKGEPQMQSVAATLVGELKKPGDIKTVAKQFDKLSSVGQMQLLTSLGGIGDGAWLETVVKGTQSENGEVRIAGLKALATVGDESTVVLLANAAAEGGRAERKAARESLYSISGKKVDGAILAGIKQADGKAKVELIGSIKPRNISGAVATLMAATRDADEAVRVESLKALRAVAAEKDVPALVRLVVEAQSWGERKEAGKTLAAVLDNSADKEAGIASMAASYKSSDDAEARGVLLEAMGRTGSSKALVVLRGALKDESSDLRKAAIRGLSDWPGIEPADDLLAIARDSENMDEHVLAVRGYVKLVTLRGERSAKESVKGLSEAMDIAKRVDEKKIILAALPDVACVEALKMALGYVEDSDLKQEAEIATVKVAGYVAGINPALARAVSEKVIEVTTNETVRKNAKKVIEQLDKFEDYIVVWEVSGPYSESNTSGDKLFDTAFGPEQGAEDVAWRIMPISKNKNTPWLMELDNVLGGNDRVAYLRTRVLSDKARKAMLELGSDDGIKVWLNGEVVHANNVNRAFTAGADKVEVNLKQGANTLMLKITQGGGQWAAGARFRGIDGGKLDGVMAEIDD
jgi:type 1 glutamine amidotransferase/HEAT repeat protein